MGNYLEKRRAKYSSPEKGFRFKLPFEKKRRVEEVVPDIGPTEVHVEYKEPGFLKRLFTFRRNMIREVSQSEELTPEEMAKLRGMEDDIEDTEKEIVEKEEEMKEIKNEETELIERREGLLTNFFGKINIFKRRPMETVEIPTEGYDEPALDQDLINVFKITHKWIDQLTPAKKRSFKASNDFQIYKEALQKYGLIKKR